MRVFAAAEAPLLWRGQPLELAAEQVASLGQLARPACRVRRAASSSTVGSAFELGAEPVELVAQFARAALGRRRERRLRLVRLLALAAARDRGRVSCGSSARPASAS